MPLVSTQSKKISFANTFHFPKVVERGMQAVPAPTLTERSTATGYKKDCPL